MTDTIRSDLSGLKLCGLPKEVTNSLLLLCVITDQLTNSLDANVRRFEELEGKLAEANSKIAFLYSDNSQRALRREPDVDLAIRQQAISLQYSLSTATMAANAYGEMDIDTIISEADQVAHWIKTGETPENAMREQKQKDEIQASLSKAIFRVPADEPLFPQSPERLECLLKEAEDNMVELLEVYERQSKIAGRIRAQTAIFKAKLDG